MATRLAATADNEGAPTMHINEADLNKIMDALMSRDPMQCLVAQSIVVKAKDARADGAMRDAAENRVMFEFHATDEIEIDDDAGTSSTDEGTWVQAWVWVPAPEEDEIECGQCEGTGTTDAMGFEEECPVCSGTGQIEAEA
jgi:hypothetical protein